MLHPAQGTFAIKPDDTAPATHRLDRSDTKLDRFLHGQIHLVAGLQGLRQRHPQRRLAFQRLPGKHFNPYLILTHGVDASNVFATRPVKQRQFHPHTQPQYPYCMTRRILRQCQAGTDSQRLRAEKSGESHHVIIGKYPSNRRRSRHQYTAMQRQLWILSWQH